MACEHPFLARFFPRACFFEQVSSRNHRPIAVLTFPLAKWLLILTCRYRCAISQRMYIITYKMKTPSANDQPLSEFRERILYVIAAAPTDAAHCRIEFRHKTLLEILRARLRGVRGYKPSV